MHTFWMRILVDLGSISDEFWEYFGGILASKNRVEQQREQKNDFQLASADDAKDFQQASEEDAKARGRNLRRG